MSQSQGAKPDRVNIPESLSCDPRYQSLDLWRGLICLYILLEHAGVALWLGSSDVTGWDSWLRHVVVTPLHWNIGTGLFFVLSGYCVLASTDSARRKGIGPIPYFGRRFWRIFPTYWAALVSLAALVGLLEWTGRSSFLRHAYALELPLASSLNLWQWLGNLGLFETWRPRIGGGDANILTRVAWSLCYQEQFYAICALLLALAPRRLFRGMFVLSVAILGLYWVLVDVGSSHVLAGFIPNRWHEFAIGMLVFGRLNVQMHKFIRYSIDAMFGMSWLNSIWTQSGGLFAVTSFALALVACRRFDLTWYRTPCLEPLRAIGRRSYSIYLIHLPVCVIGSAYLAELGILAFWSRALITVPLLIVASLLVSWLFYAAVESHFVNPARKPAPIANWASGIDRVRGYCRRAYECLNRPIPTPRPVYLTRAWKETLPFAPAGSVPGRSQRSSVEPLVLARTVNTVP